MKQILCSIFFGILVLLLEGCKKNQSNGNDFTYESAAGLWILYEIKDGSVINNDVSLQKVFGAYSESVQLNADQTFIPVAWINSNDFKLSTAEQGTYEYFPVRQTLKFDGTFHDEYNIAKFQENDLWLSINGSTLKLKRQ